MLILLSDAFDPSLPGRLEKFGEVTDDKRRAAEANVVLIRSKTKVTREYIDAAPKLRLVIRGGVGLDNVDQVHAKARGIEVHNTAAASSVAVAELAMAMMLALPNHLVQGHNSMVAGQWLKKELKRTELYHKTLGILGCGRIGRELARRAAAFDMTILGYDIVSIDDPLIAQVADPNDLLRRADYISIHLPLTDATAGMIHAGTLAQMKDGVRIVNTGRGKVVIEKDVVAALESGKIAGYATDVWYSDPPENTPLLGAPNTLLLPHIGASTEENLLRIGDIIVELLEDYTQRN
ncbi:MAG: hydroxyacid dehydrogenase [Planctomycetes bacterium]|nr:hydroxyacid dehydrogenase [Planctomycetota bacterium]